MSDLTDDVMAKLVPILCSSRPGAAAIRRAETLLRDSFRAAERQGMRRAIEIQRYRGARGPTAVLQGLQAALSKL